MADAPEGSPPTTEADESEGLGGSFFDPISNTELARKYASFRSSEQLQLLSMGQGEYILDFMLATLGYIDFQQTPADTRTTAHPVQRRFAELVALTGNYYARNYWKDFVKREGQDIDRLEVLIDKTQEFVPQSELLSLILEIKAQHRDDPHITDTERILRILLHNERYPENVDLP